MGTVLSQLNASGFLAQDALETLDQTTLTTLLTRAAKAAAINCGREGCDPPTAAELA
jgi:fructokinase